MLINSGKTILNAQRLAVANLKQNAIKNIYVSLAAGQQQLHTSAARLNIAETEPLLPIPNNVDAAEQTHCFSPQRTRDISATFIHAQQAPISTIDITAESTLNAANYQSNGYGAQDPHVQSYDCFGAVSLNSVMQSNVPTPFGGMHKFSHLNMPGGQWAQEYKFMSQNLQSAHYRALRDSARADWVVYDQNATLDNKKGGIQYYSKRCYSTDMNSSKDTKQGNTATSQPASTATLTKKEQLKQAFKDYGATIIVFHVGISLISLGGCYLLISSGVNMMPIMEFLGISESAFAEKLATGSTFVVAYAVHKVFAPVRLSITLGAAPFIVRYLRSKGLLKAKNKLTS